MRVPVAILLLAALPAWPANAPSGCAQLCGNWMLDGASADAARAAIDTAVHDYKDPRPRYRERRLPEGNAAAASEADMENSIGPIFDRPRREDLRTELAAVLTPPAKLTLAAKGDDILIQAADDLPRSVSVGEPHSRVDEQGTAEIRVSWKYEALVISETYDRKRRQIETYALQRDGTLLVTREVARPGVKTIRIQAVYRRT